MAVVDPDHEEATASCAASTTDWTLLIFTILAVNVNWWLLKIPVLVYKGPRAYFNGVVWQCVRNCLPGVAAYLALRESDSPTAWATIYYQGPLGPSRKVGEEGRTYYRPLTATQYAQYAFSDTIIVVATIMSLVQFCRAPPDADLSGLNAAAWMYPTLPVALNGFFFSVFGTGYLGTLRRRYVALLAFLMHALILVTFALVMRFAPARDRGMWFPAMFLYFIMAAPVAMVPQFLLVVAMTALAALSRVAGVAAGAMSGGNAYFPYCPLRNGVFGGIYLGFGLLAGALAIYGRIVWSPTQMGAMFVKQFWFVIKV